MYLKFFSYNTFLISFCRYVITREFLTEIKLGRKPKVDLFHFPNTRFYAVLIFTCSCGVLLSILVDEPDSLWETHRFTGKKFIFPPSWKL